MSIVSSYLVRVEVVSAGNSHVREEVFVPLRGDGRRRTGTGLAAKSIVVRTNWCNTQEERLAAVELESIVQETESSFGNQVVTVFAGESLRGALVSLERCIQVEVRVGIQKN